MSGRGLTVLAVVAFGAIAVDAEFYCSPIWGTHPTRGPNNGNPRYRVSARTAADVAAMNARFGPNRCHTNCNSTEARFIWFQYSPRSYPFIMDGTCPTPNEPANTNVYNLVDLDQAVGNNTDFRCGHHRGIGHDAGYYSIVLEHCLSKIGTLNAYARAPTSPPTRRPTSAPTRRPTSVPTRRPTSVPTHRPTPSPTAHPCTGGNHGCDTSTTMCVAGAGSSFSCACLQGFVPMLGSTTQCMVAPTPPPTPMPTSPPSRQPTMVPTTPNPTAPPTAAPLPDPCTSNTHMCDPASTTCAPYGLAPWYTCLCNIGFLPGLTATPWTQRSCIPISSAPTAPPPTSPPSTSSANSGGSSGSSGGGSTLTYIGVIVVATAAIVGGLIVYSKKSSGGAASSRDGAGPTGFDNPLYATEADRSDTVQVTYDTADADDAAEDAGGYMDVTADGGAADEDDDAF